jgi:hypothetical protein
MKLEQTILKNLIYNEEYMRKVLPFLNDSYFFDKVEKNIYKEINEFVDKYNTTPNLEVITLSLQDRKNISGDEYKNVIEYIDKIKEDKSEESKLDWLVDKTEKFCQEKAIYNAVLNSIHILDGKDKQQDKGSIPKILSDALAISFDSSVGHDYFENWDDRYEFYHRKEEKIPFDLEYFNKITKGGLHAKTLNIALAGCVHPDTKVTIRYRKRISK